MTAQNKKPIREIGISEFRMKCLSLLKEVSKTKAPLRVTRRGKPIVDVIPIEDASSGKRDWLGSMAGSFEITGYIISPVFPMPEDR